MEIRYRTRFAVDDTALSRLHARAFDYAETPFAWGRVLGQPATVTFVGAFLGADLVGFAQARRTDPGQAGLLDVAVDPDRQRRGIGLALVRHVIRDVEAAGLSRLLVEFEPPLSEFYFGRCGFSRRDATTGVRWLSRPQPPV
ncbi:GNAT family N-acetyltransferase [Actinoplanes sp. NPDC023936]|uniref:GNAT family N-acetyltransferase n=1 Tax=Actinoplanes sp. NPDC023936 TaxID=3154910 RepID=UPI0033F99C97